MPGVSAGGAASAADRKVYLAGPPLGNDLDRLTIVSDTFDSVKLLYRNVERTEAMESLSVASAAANLLSISVHIAGCLYRKWDDNSRPGSERLMYEVSRLRSLLENIEIESATEQPIVAGELRRSFDDTRATLLYLLVALNGDMHYEWLWETYSSSRPGACLPLSRQDLDKFARLLLSHFTEIRKK